MKLKGNRIVVIPENMKDQTLGGIYIPETKQEERNVGIVATIGDTCERDVEGRRVLFTRNTGVDIVYEGLDAKLLYSHDIIAFLN